MDLTELLKRPEGKSFDEQALPELDSEALDWHAASECFAPVRKLKKSDLETLRLLVPHQGRKVPSIGGVLLFGRDPDVRRTHSLAACRRGPALHRTVDPVEGAPIGLAAGSG